MSKKQALKDIKKKLSTLQHNEKCLREMISLIDSEMGRLEVERMHLQNQVVDEDEESGAEDEKSVTEILKEMDDTSVVNQKNLDLNVVSREEEEEDEGDG